jgi:hypothetical protein
LRKKARFFAMFHIGSRRRRAQLRASEPVFVPIFTRNGWGKRAGVNCLALLLRAIAGAHAAILFHPAGNLNLAMAATL